MAQENELVMRYQSEAYMECGSGDDKKYHLIGEGFTTLSEAKNPKEYSRKYVNYKTEKSDVIGYAPSVSYTCDCISGDPVVAEIIHITDHELVGTQTHREVVMVNCWGEQEGDSYPAFKRTYAVIPANKGDGTDALIYTGTMKAVSDVTIGKFDRKTLQFTADGESAVPTQQNDSTKPE